MNIPQKSDLVDLISNTQSIAKQLRVQILHNNYEEADKVSISYGKSIEEILSYPVSNFIELKLKIGFIFDNLLDDSDNEEGLLKYKTIIENDVTHIEKQYC